MSGKQRPHWHSLPRPTKKIGTQAEKLLDYEISGRHYALWLNLGKVCWQIKWRLWRFGFEFVYWRSYDP
jgi:hypothetical protein